MISNCRPYRAHQFIVIIDVTKLPPLQGSSIHHYHLCYQTVAPTGLDNSLLTLILPNCRPYRAQQFIVIIYTTKLPPIQGCYISLHFYKVTKLRCTLGSLIICTSKVSPIWLVDSFLINYFIIFIAFTGTIF